MALAAIEGHEPVMGVKTTGKDRRDHAYCHFARATTTEAGEQGRAFRHTQPPLFKRSRIARNSAINGLFLLSRR